MEEKILSKEIFQSIIDFILGNSRDLEKAECIALFLPQKEHNLLDILANYQNSDGGFGHGIEPDFTLPSSTPMATSIALEVLDRQKEVCDSSKWNKMMQQTLQYLVDSYIPERNGWFAVTKEINNYPHAPWWTWNEETQQTVIDEYWGNPSAELIGFIAKYDYLLKKQKKDFSTEHVLDFAVNNLNQKNKFNSEHEIYCYVRLYNLTNPGYQAKLLPKIKEIVNEQVNLEPKDWQEYVPTPLKYVNSPKKESFGLSEKAFDTNLNYLVDKLEDKPYILPNWKWGQYPESWEKAKQHWTGILTLRAVRALKNFGRIDDSKLIN